MKWFGRSGYARKSNHHAGLGAYLCSEVLEHEPEPKHALDEFVRLFKPSGMMILTAPNCSNVHMALYH
jgi:2-polyprenyl-3-methyl-5-hydroxy-6-metoxy-1,4-benzoquinol methylase